jgi:hypothetical protein
VNSVEKKKSVTGQFSVKHKSDTYAVEGTCTLERLRPQILLYLIGSFLSQLPQRAARKSQENKAPNHKLPQPLSEVTLDSLDNRCKCTPVRYSRLNMCVRRVVVISYCHCYMPMASSQARRSR